MDEFPEQYLEALRLFNDEEFFDCHDVLEELWSETLGEEKRFFQGLIQAAVALFHFGNGNLGGARKMYETARKNLEPYGDEYGGIDLAQFRTDFKHCFQELLDARDVYPEGVELRDDRVPKIRMPNAE